LNGVDVVDDVHGSNNKTKRGRRFEQSKEKSESSRKKLMKGPKGSLRDPGSLSTPHRA